MYLLAAERLPHAWAANFDFWAITSGFLIGETSFFWLWTVPGGAIPILLMAITSIRKRTWAVFVAGALAVFGVVFEGVRLIFEGYRSVNINDAPGITVGEYAGMGTNIWAQSGVYAPTLIEIAIVTGLLAVGALIVTVELHYLPIQRTDMVAESIADGGKTE